MSAPVLNRPLVLEALGRVADGAGGFVESWAALGALWADLRPGTGRDAPGPEVTLAATPFRIMVRAAPQGAASRPRPGQRFRDGGRVFPILAVTESDATGRFLVCFTREEVPV